MAIGYRLLSIKFLGIPLGPVTRCALRVAGVRDTLRSLARIRVTCNPVLPDRNTQAMHEEKNSIAHSQIYHC